MNIDDIPDERVRAMVKREGDCWVWTGSTGEGYGQFIRRRGGKQHKSYAHRYSYETFVGPVPAGHNVVHARGCTRRRCLNPQHLTTRQRTHGFASAARHMSTSR